ncbi:MAG: inositol monophosphatase family protein [Gammaproteobacteria bacterium]|jgi:myo-inositol-1(or 4)-monophosphatase|tara:strand:- start:7388 stop:8164 length:777 start_codon:yes stop_codon:yes gene_type:complete
MQPMLNIAIRAARRAGTIVSRAQNRLYDLKIELKGHNDYVTQTDVEAEAAIIEVLNEAYPSHSIVAEESGSSGASDFKWIIDPIDGTLNFIHGFPSYAISIALQVKGRLEQAVIYDPTRDEMYTASRGAGAQLNGQRIRVSPRTELDSSILGTGFPLRNKNKLPNYLLGFTTLLNKSADIRRTGSAALDLAYVACGRLDGYWEFDLHEWDIAAGALLVQESGGLIGDPEGGETHLQTGNVVAANPKIFRQILAALRSS